MTEFEVCSMSLFGRNISHFFSDSLHAILEKFPVLEFPHKQNFYTILFIESADGELILDNNKIRLDKAKAVIIRPGCMVKIDINRQAKGQIVCFTEDFFSLRYNNNILYQFSFLKHEAKSYARLNAIQAEKWKLLSNLLSDEFKLQKRESYKVLRSYLNILLFELERLYNPQGHIKTINPKSEKIQQFEDLINKHFTIKKLPSAYAEMLNMTPNYLNKLCKKETGQTAGYLIRKRIIIEAQRLLHYTSFTVSEIADQLGFESISYFDTFFKKNTGFTPEQFRKNES
jgi:AraC family transcriptional activator of pobA